MTVLEVASGPEHRRGGLAGATGEGSGALGPGGPVRRTVSEQIMSDR
jgi:hypothetical protein